MSYFAPYIDETGLHLPSYGDVLEYLVDGYKSIFGSNLHMGADTQDYQMISLFANCWSDLLSVVMDAYSSRNPDWATGQTLDALCAINGVSRTSATPSSAVLTLTGTPGATLAAGSSARDSVGYSWEITNQVTFGSDGSATVTAYCTIPGSINAEAGTITIIETPSLDWSSVTNEKAIPGNNDESDADLRARRRRSVALSARSVIESIDNALIAIDGVTRVKVLENTDNSIDANGTGAHSIQAVVDGGDNSKIAEEIYLNKAPGIGTSGTTSVSYVDIYGATSTVKFSRPVSTTVNVSITAHKKSGWDSESETSIKNAVTGYINGLPIGEDLIVPTIYSAIYASGSSDFVITNISANGSSSSISSTATGVFKCGTITMSYT